MTASQDPSSADTASLEARLARLTPQQRELLRRRTLAQRASGHTEADLPRAEPWQRLPLTPAQRQMWVFERLQPGTSTYHVHHNHRFEGPIDVDALARACAAVTARHDALRMAFSETGGTPAQTVRDDVVGSLSVIDLSALPADVRDTECTRRVAEEGARPFDLAQPPLIRYVLLKQAPDLHVLVIVAHHIVTDAWSLGVIEQDLVAYYDAFAAGSEPAPAPALRFADLVLRQTLPAHVARIDRQLDDWSDALAGATGLLDLPVDRPRGAQPSAAGARHVWRLPDDVHAGVLALARAERVTPFAVLLCAFQSLLARWSGDDDVVVGSPISNRGEPGFEAAVGLFVNTVAMRARIGDDPGFREALHRARDITLRALENAEAPLERVIERVSPERAPGRTPLFQTMFVLQQGGGGTMRLGEAQATYLDPEVDTARFELTLSVSDDTTAYTALFDYATDLFDAATIQRLAKHYDALLRAAIAQPDLPLSRLPLIDEAERAALVRLGDGGPGLGSAADTLHGLFASQVARTPDAPALVTPARTWTYAEVARCAAGLAQALQARGVSRGACVAVLADRSAEAVIGLLGILAAGAAYLPLDPGSPDERLHELLADSGAHALVAPPALAGRGAALAGALPLLGIEAEADAFPVDTADADDVAYLIYTSGSTGKPKGVKVQHRGAVNLVQGFLARHRFEGQRLLMIPPLIFDASVGDVFPVLACGSALVLHPAPAELGSNELERFCTEHGVTAIDAPATLWRRWSEGWALRNDAAPLLPALNLMMIGGESVPVEQVRRFAAVTGGRVTLCNHYGPTEASVCATLLATVDGHEVRMLDLPIGRPLPGVCVYVVDRHLQLAPLGVVGELCIGGAGVAVGYHDAPALTAERFPADPFAGVAGAKMYRTGDLARWNTDGTLQFIGRRDHQIKLRGFRIELGEIEAALAAQPGVQVCAVQLREDRPSDRRLVAYVVAEAGIDAAALRGGLARRLPDAMLPSSFVFLDAMPVTANGKIDRRALPAPADQASDARTVRGPRTPTEETVLAVWRDVLGREHLGIDDDFFGSGGDSLSTLPLVSKLQAALGLEVPVAAVFASPTVAGLSDVVDRLRAGIEERFDIEAEVVLPEDIDASRASPPRAERGAPRSVLLTGATGFLGAYLLRDLIDLSDAEVVCLVRAADEDEGLRRIRANLERYGLWRESDAARIAPLPGNLASPRLGQTEAGFDALAHRVDAIVHNGGEVNFLAPYARLEPANVGGTRDVLRLATSGHLKPVQLVSTLGVYVTPLHAGVRVTEGHVPPDGPGQEGGYNQSKWVAEQLGLLARTRGVPVAIHRPARVTGDATSGAGNVDDYFSSWVRGCAQLGLAPRLPGDRFDMTPVDYVARTIVRCVLGESDANAQFHYYNPRTLAIEDVVETIRDLVGPIEEVEYTAWRRALGDALAAGRDNALKPFASLFPATSDGDAPAMPDFDCGATEAFAARRGAVCPPADRALFERYVHFLQACHALPVRGESVA